MLVGQPDLSSEIDERPPDRRNFADMLKLVPVRIAVRSRRQRALHNPGLCWMNRMAARGPRPSMRASWENNVLPKA